MSPTARLVGEPVTVSGVGDLVAGHGRFRLENPGPGSIHAVVAAASLDVGGQSRELEPATVYDIDHGRAFDPHGFDAGPGTMTFLLGFPRVTDESRPGEQTSVRLRLAIGDATVEARSPIVFERRHPKRP
jgi:hypothetical protein